MIGLIIAASLIVLIGWIEWAHMRERRYLTNLLIARTPNEARILNREFDSAPQPTTTPDPYDTIDGFEGPVGI